MPKKAKELTPVEVKRLTWGTIKKTEGNRKAGESCAAYHAVGGVAGLLLQCRPSPTGAAHGSRSWILRVVIGNKRRDMGLGGYPDVSLAQARDMARKIKEDIRQGIDPIAERNTNKSKVKAGQTKAVTFKQLSQEYIAKKTKEYKTAKQVQRLQTYLSAYVYPVIGSLLMADIQRTHVLQILSPIWYTKHETASRVRLNLEKILDLAAISGLRSGDNPARWSGNIEHSLPPRSKVSKVTHYAMLAVEDIPQFIKRISEHDSISFKALVFCILTAGRSSEVRGALWNEINLTNKTWVIPPERMKMGKAHTVPLSDKAIVLLESLPRLGQYIFTSSRGGSLCDVSLSKAPKVVGYNVTAHGFRSTFSTWAQECTSYEAEVVELALAHINSDATRAAYARSELIEKRRLLMNDWADYCFSTVTH